MGDSQSYSADVGAAEATVLHGLGVSAFQRGKVDTALKFISRACAFPDAPAIWHRNHAEILDRCGDPEAAEAAARLALLRDPECAGAWETLGTILAQRGKHEESCTCYEKAVEIEPDFVQALNNLAVTLDRLGRREAAETRYRQVLRLVPEHTEIQLNFATLLGELGNFEEGLDVAHQVLKRRPNLMRAHSIAAQFERKFKRRTKSGPKKSASGRYVSSRSS